MPGEVDSSRVFLLLGALLVLVTFGWQFILMVVLAIVSLIVGLLTALIYNGWERSEELLKEFNSIEGKNSPGIRQFVENSDKKRRLYPPPEKLTGSPLIDPIVEEIITYALRDYVEAWYGMLTNDESWLESLRNSANQTVNNISSSLRKVDWTPLLTQQIIDDFATHIRLYRKAVEKRDAKKNSSDSGGSEESGEDKDGELEGIFFDIELEMEKNENQRDGYCRDLVSTDRKYENAYLHDLADILMYLLIPPEDFRSRPFRFLIREIFVRKLLCPIIDTMSDPDYINFTIVWLLNDVPISPDDFLCIIEASDNTAELASVKECIDEEIGTLRAKDTGGNDDTVIKQQLSSLAFLKKLVTNRIQKIGHGNFDAVDGGLGLDEPTITKETSKLYDLDLSYVLSNSISISYFMDFLNTVDGESYIDLFLAIEGFKVSVEHQLSSAHLNRVTSGAPLDREVLETIREAALSLYHQYLSDDAISRVQIDVILLRNLLSRIKSESPSDNWFDEVQSRLFDTLEQDVRFYPAFQRSPLYFRMLADLALINRDGTRVDDTDVAHCSEAIDNVSLKSGMSSGSGSNEVLHGGHAISEEPILTAHISTIGVGCEGKHAFALYNINVTRDNSDGTQSSWNILRRYSDFHTLHTLIQQKFPNLGNLSFPSKKTFNNMNQEFLEKRKRSLNNYLRALLYPEILRQYSGLEGVVVNFLCQKDYIPEKGIISKKVLSLVNPIRSGVRSFGQAVTSVPDTVFEGVSKMGDGIGKVTKTVLGDGARTSNLFHARFLSSFFPDRWLENPLLNPLWGSSRHAQSLYRLRVGGSGTVGRGGEYLSSPVEGRVGAGISGDAVADNIPLRILLLLMDEVFGLRHRNQWFRRRLVAFLRQLIHAAFGTSINKKIVDFVTWLTKEEQVAEYLKTFRNCFWPNGVMADPTPERPLNMQMRTRVVAKAKMLAALPDELRLFIGNETSRSGTQLVFDALQNPHLNRRLCYVLLERLLVTVFPENNFSTIFPKLHSKSPRCQSSDLNN